MKQCFIGIYFAISDLIEIKFLVELKMNDNSEYQQMQEQLNRERNEEDELTS